MKILIIYQHYLGPSEPGGLRFNEFARAWSAAGHHVTVVAGTVNYATGEDRPECRGRLLTRQKDGAVTVIRAHVPATYSKSYLGRSWAFFGFTLSATAAVLAAESPDVIIASSPPLVAGIPGWLAARLKRPGRKIPLIFEVRDLWPESAETTGVLGKNSAPLRALYGLEKLTYQVANRINVLTPAFRDNLISRGLAEDRDIWLIPNGADTDVYRPGERDNAARKDLGWGDKFVAIYAGAHGRANALHQLIEAAEQLRDRPDILIACVGDGAQRKDLAREAERRRLTNISFHGSRPKSEMPEIINGSDVGVAVLQDNPTFKTVYPNKVFDYMSCARPVVLGIDGAARELVCDKARAGVFAEPENGASIAHRLRQLADDPEARAVLGQNGRDWVVQNASRDVLAQHYLDQISDLVAREGSRRPR